MTIGAFAREIAFLCGKYNLSQSSGHRTIEHNRQVGGAHDSQHLGYKAADLVAENWNEKDDIIFAAKVANLWVGDEVGTKNHLHIDDRNNA